jgi:hypothetical protein
VSQVVFGLRVMIKYEYFPPFIGAGSDDKIILQFPVYISSIAEAKN